MDGFPDRNTDNMCHFSSKAQDGAIVQYINQGGKRFGKARWVHASVSSHHFQQFKNCHSDDRREEESQVPQGEILSFGRLRTGSRFAPSEWQMTLQS
jgi:hypothetical protein